MTANEIKTALAEPFDANDLHHKPKIVKGNRCLALTYVDARAVMDRLDEVLGIDGWEDNYEMLPDGSVMCRLTLHIEGTPVTRSDVGSQSEQSDAGDRVKAAFSDALKRAAVRFGVGRYLYRLPSTWMDYDPQTKRIITAKVNPIDDARARFKKAQTLAVLAAEWDATPADLRSQLIGDKENRKRELSKAA